MNLGTFGTLAASAAAGGLMLAALMPAVDSMIEEPLPDPAVAYTDLRERSAVASPLFAECFESAAGGKRLAVRRLPWPAPAAHDADGDGYHDKNGLEYVAAAGQAAYTRHEPAAGNCAGLTAAPAAPTGVAATGGSGSITLSWDDPGDPSITGYEYIVNHNATGTGNFTGWSPDRPIPGSGAHTTSHTFTGLTPGREYRYYLKAVNGAGRTGASAPSVPCLPGRPGWFACAVVLP